MSKTEMLLTLFAGYGAENNQTRLKAYMYALQDIEPELLEKACRKVFDEWPHAALPSVGYIRQACKSLYTTVNPDVRLADWPEALAEIEAAMYLVPWGHKPHFTRLEIELTVKAFGWRNIHEAHEKDMPTIRAQLRDIYKGICSRAKDDSNNSYILGLGGNPFRNVTDKFPNIRHLQRINLA